MCLREMRSKDVGRIRLAQDTNHGGLL